MNRQKNLRKKNKLKVFREQTKPKDFGLRKNNYIGINTTQVELAWGGGVLPLKYEKSD